jgi:hypothetical protein
MDRWRRFGCAALFTFPLMIAGPAVGQETAPDSIATPVVSGQITSVPEKTSGGFLKSPTGVAVRSLLIPGWGQATNREWLKAGLVLGVEGAFIYGIIQDTNTLNGLDPYDPRYTVVEDNRIAKFWWLGGIVFLSMIDAFVGAHLKDVDATIEPEPLEGGVALRLSARFP